MLGKSRQSYYKQKHRKGQKQEQSCRVIDLVRKCREDMPRVGTLKLYELLYDQLRSMKVGRDKLNTILKVNGMLVVPLKKYKVTTNSRHMFKRHEDLVSGLKITRPEQVWVSDITYIYNRDRYYYMSLVTDAYSKRIMGYSLSPNMNVELVLRSMQMAYQHREYKRKIIHHSDRGTQYCCNEYQRMLKRMGIRVSMTQNSDPYSNAIAERVNGIIKQEFLLEQKNCSFEELKMRAKKAVEVYNNLRPHSSYHMLTPVNMHKQQKLSRMEYKKQVHPIKNNY